MTSDSEPVTAAVIDRVFREEHGRAVSVLVRFLGDIDATERAFLQRRRRDLGIVPGRHS